MRRPRGRFWLGLWLAFVLAVLTWVVARQTSAVVTAADLEGARTQRSVLEARKAQLLQRIRRAESRAVLIPRARDLGLRSPTDTEIVILQTPTSERP